MEPKKFKFNKREAERIIREIREVEGVRHFATVLNHLSLLCRLEADKWYFNLRTGKPIKQNVGERFMLVVTEVAEAMEGERKNLMDDKLPHRKMVEVELADALIRIFDFAGEEGLDLGGALLEKLEYNAKRKDHTREHRLGPGGKKF